MHMYKYAFYGVNKSSAKPKPNDVLKDIQKIEYALEHGPEVPSAQYFLLQLKTVYWELKGNFNNQVRFARQLRDLFVKHPHLGSDIRNINAYLQEFTALLNLSAYKEALESIREAQNLAVPGTSSYFEITKTKCIRSFTWVDYTSSQNCRRLTRRRSSTRPYARKVALFALRYSSRKRTIWLG